MVGLGGLRFLRYLGADRLPRAEEIAVDWTVLAFALAIPSEPSPREVEDCVAGVAALIRQDRLSRQLRPRRRPWLAAAAAGVVTVSL